MANLSSKARIKFEERKRAWSEAERTEKNRVESGAAAPLGERGAERVNELRTQRTRFLAAGLSLCVRSLSTENVKGGERYPLSRPSLYAPPHKLVCNGTK